MRVMKDHIDSPQLGIEGRKLTKDIVSCKKSVCLTNDIVDHKVANEKTHNGIKSNCHQPRRHHAGDIQVMGLGVKCQRHNG